MSAEHLDRDHEAFRSSPERLREAERAVLELGLDAASGYRVELEPQRLKALLGEERFAELFPGAAPVEAAQSAYDVYEGELDPRSSSDLLDALTPAEGQPTESPSNYIRSIRLLDESHRTVLRSGSQGTFLLLALPPDARGTLSERLAELGLPEDVVVDVDVDPEELQP